MCWDAALACLPPLQELWFQPRQLSSCDCGMPRLALQVHSPSSVLPFKCTPLQVYSPSSVLPFKCTPLQVYSPSSVLPFKCTPLQVYSPPPPSGCDGCVSLHASPWTFLAVFIEVELSSPILLNRFHKQQCH